MSSTFGVDKDLALPRDLDEHDTGSTGHVSFHHDVEYQSVTKELNEKSDSKQIVASDGSHDGQGPLSRASSSAVLTGLQKPQHLSLLLQSLLQEKCSKMAADQVNKDRDPNDRLLGDHPDVLAVAQRLYEKMSTELTDSLGLPKDFAGSEHLEVRETYISGFNKVLAKAATKELEEMAAKTPEEHPAKIFAGLGPPSTPRKRRTTFANFQSVKTETGLPTIDELLSPTSILVGPQPTFTSGSVYKDEYEEIGLLGKGGYGSVYSVKSHLDLQQYAIKKIKIPALTSNFQGKNPIAKILAELHTLAKLHHPNIVRYFHGWAERAVDVDILAPSAHEVHSTGLGLLPQPETGENSNGDGTADDFEASELRKDTELDSSENHIHGSKQRSLNEYALDDNIVFGYSSAHSSEGAQQVQEGIRRASIATISSAIQSSVVSVSDHENDPDVEIIPRDLDKQTGLPLGVIERSIPGNPTAPLLENNRWGSGFILHIKMSLHPMTLATFLSTEPVKGSDSIIRHCFHQELSVGILEGILDGVEYLHSQNIIHRDLKPANILLTITKDRAPYSTGCVNILACGGCADHDSSKKLYITPCISDFGLIAEIKAPIKPAESNITGKVAPLSSLQDDLVFTPVGTLLYRPLTMPKEHPVICPKVDVYALGVITLETVYKFGTRSERAHVLNNLKRGILPSDFVTHPMADGILAMACNERGERWGCPEVRQWLVGLEGKGKGVA